MPQDAGGRGKDYRESDVRTLFQRGPDWAAWQDPVQWLRTYGNRDGELRSADVRGLLERDFQKLQADGVPFTKEPGTAYNLAREHRSAKLEQAHGSQRPSTR